MIIYDDREGLKITSIVAAVERYPVGDFDAISPSRGSQVDEVARNDESASLSSLSTMSRAHKRPVGAGEDALAHRYTYHTSRRWRIKKRVAKRTLSSFCSRSALACQACSIKDA